MESILKMSAMDALRKARYLPKDVSRLSARRQESLPPCQGNTSRPDPLGLETAAVLGRWYLIEKEYKRHQHQSPGILCVVSNPCSSASYRCLDAPPGLGGLLTPPYIGGARAWYNTATIGLLKAIREYSLTFWTWRRGALVIVEWNAGWVWQLRGWLGRPGLAKLQSRSREFMVYVCSVKIDSSLLDPCRMISEALCSIVGATVFGEVVPMIGDGALRCRQERVERYSYILEE